MFQRLLFRSLCTAVRQVNKPSHSTSYFQQLQSGWWSHNGEVETLHNLNTMRVPFILNSLLKLEITTCGPVTSPRPLNGWKILDVGCGGGILSEALARLGATVTGIDVSQAAINAAKEHTFKDAEIRNNVTYICTNIESLIQDHANSFDVVVASEVLEHVTDIDKFISSCLKMGNNDASVFFTTINRTWKSYALAIIAAEYLLRIIDIGVHEWDSFVKPEEVEVCLLKRGYKVKLVKGMKYCPVTRRFIWSDDLSVNYALHAVKS